MDYNTLKKIIANKGMTIHDFCLKIKKTEQGFYSAIKKNTLKVRDLEKAADILEIPVEEFFKTDSKKLYNTEIENKESNIIKESEMKLTKSECHFCDHIIKLKDDLQQKEKIIQLLEFKVHTLENELEKKHLKNAG